MTTQENYEFSDELLDSYVNKWVHKALLAGPEIDEKALRVGIDFLYTLSDLKPPQEIIICDSPDAVQSTAQRLLKSKSYVNFSTSSLHNPGWVAFYDLFNNETEALDAESKKLFESYVDFLSSGVFASIYLDEAAIVSRRPVAVRRDEEFRLHHDSLPAIEFQDGFKLFSLDGVVFEENLFRKISDKTITPKEINAISNADQRAIAYKYGLPPQAMLKDMGAELIHTGIRGTKLYKVPNFYGTATTQYAMLMDCPTGREFLEFVPPEIGQQGDADLAQANAYSITKEEYLSIQLHG